MRKILLLAVTMGACWVLVSPIMIAPKRAQAAPSAQPTVLVSLICSGTVANPVGAVLNAGELHGIITFFSFNPVTGAKGIDPTAGKNGAVQGAIALQTKGQCVGPNFMATSKSDPPKVANTPCFQGGDFSGTITTNPNKLTGSVGEAMTITFSDPQQAPLGPPATGISPLDGCTLSFALQPFAKKTQIYAIGTSLLGGTCTANGSRILISCTGVHN